MRDVVVSVVLEEDTIPVLAITHGSRSHATQITERIKLVGQNAHKVRGLFRRFGFDVDELEFDDKGALISPEIVGLAWDSDEAIAPHVSVPSDDALRDHARRQATHDARWTDEARERHGIRVHHGAQKTPKERVPLALSDLDQACPRCRTREAASEYCTACASPTGPATWYDRKEYERATMSLARAGRRRT